MSEYLCRRESVPTVVNRETPSILGLQQCDLRLLQLNRKLEALADDRKAMVHQKAELLSAISETKREMESIRRGMRHESRLGHFLPFELGVRDLQELLEKRQLVVILEVTKHTLYRIEVAKSSIRTFRLELNDQFFEDMNRLRDMLALPIDFDQSEIFSLADRLSEWLCPRQIKGFDHYAFVTHQNLRGFPLAILRHKGSFLIESHKLSQSPNLPVLYFTLQRPSSPRLKPVFFFSNHQGDPKGLERVVLASEFPEAQWFSHFSDHAIPRAVARSDFIHFAGHCHVDRRLPNQSYLRFGPNKLSLSTLARIRFHGRPFVNLAACRSGWMAWAAGNELYGFVSTAFAAGASQVLAALWDIDDQATGEWMTAFYQHMARGAAGAYQVACREMIQRGMHPRLWSGFSLLGHP